MKRSEFQAISRLRVKEAKILLDNGCYSGAYYLIGYSVECAIKACIAKQIRRHDIPEPKFVKDIYTHNLEKLVQLSGYGEELKSDIESNPDLQLNWAIVKDWSEESRYQDSIPAKHAFDLYSAITQRRNGVLGWMKKRW